MARARRGRPPERLTAQHEGINFLAPLDFGTLLYIARDEDGSGPWLWALDIATRSAQRVPSGVNQYTSVASSRDGRRVVATVVNPSASLWRVPLLDRAADERDAALYPLPVPAGFAVAPRFGGEALFYLSARSTADGLWRVEGRQASHVWRAVDGSVFDPPAISRDGQSVALVVRQRGKRRLWIMSADVPGVERSRPRSTSRASQVRPPSSGLRMVNASSLLAKTVKGRRCSKSLQTAATLNALSAEHGAIPSGRPTDP